MASDLTMAFNVIARDGASPAFRTVAAEAKALQRAIEESDAKMSASSRAATAEINRSMSVLGRAHTETALQYDRANATMIGANDSLEASSAKLSASMDALVTQQRAAAASAVEMGSTIDTVSAETAAATEASAAKRKAAMMNFGLGSAAAVAFIGYESVKAATKFESSMARVQTMAGASSKELAQMSAGILKLAPQVGIGPDKLAESLYHVESAGFHGAKALELVASASKLAAIGQDDINSSTQAVIATMASNIKGVRDANDAAAQILHTVGTGDMTMHQFTQALGTGLLPTAAAVGLSFKDVGAAIATMTDNAIPADQAATKLRTSLLMMVNPSRPAIAALQSIGMNAQQLAGDLQKPDGLKVALDDIRSHLDAAFPKNSGAPLSIHAQKVALDDYRQSLMTAGVQGKELDAAVSRYAENLKHGTTNTVLQEQAFAKMFGGSKNAGTMLVLFNEQLDRMDPKLASFGDATSRAAELQAAWAKQQDTFKQKLNDLGATFDVMKIKIGNALLPVLKDVIGFMGSHIGLVEGLAFAIGTVLVGATVAWTVALQTNPIVLFVEAIALVGVEIYMLVTHFKQVTDFLRGPWGTAVTVAIATILPFVGIPVLIYEHWHGIADFFKGIWHGISQAFEHPGELAGKVIDRVKEIPGAITTATGDAAHWLWDAAKRAAGGLWDTLIDGIRHGYRVGERIGRAIADAIGDLSTQIAHFIAHTDWGKVFGDTVKAIGDFFFNTDWGHVAKVIVDGLVHAFEWAWKNKQNIMKIAGIIVGGFLLAVYAIPAALLFIGGSIVAGIVSGMVQAAKPAAEAVGRFFVRMFHDIVNPVSSAVGAVSRFFERMRHDITGAIGAAVDFIGRHWRTIITLFMGPVGFVIAGISRFGKQIGGLFERLWHDVSGFASRMWRDVSGWFARMGRDVGGFAARMWRDVTGWFSRMWRDVSGFASRIWKDVSGWFARMWHDLAGFASRIWKDVTSWVSRMWRDVTGFASRIWQDVTGWFSRLWHDLTNIATRLWHDVTAPFQSMWDGLKRGFDDVVHGIETSWHKLGEIFAAPIRFLVHYVYDDAIVKVWNAVMGVVGEKGRLGPVDYNAIHFATGGVIPGNHERDDVPFYGTPGEVVVPKPVVARFGGPDSLMSTLGFDGQGGNAGAHLAGGGPLGLGKRLLHDVTHNPVTDAIGDGAKAVLHGVQDVAGALAGLVRGALADTAGPILDGAVSLLGKLVPGNNPVDKAALGLGHGMVDKVMNWVRGQDAKDQALLAAMGGGDGTSAPLIIEYARRHGFNGGATTTTGGHHVNGSYHYLGEAVDFGNAAWPDQRGLFNLFDHVAGSLLELFWDPAGHFVKNGQRIPGAIGGHGDHVHVAASVAAMDGLLGIPVSYNSSAGLAAGGVKSMVQQAAAARGWGNQFGALDYIISHESSWNPNAQNPGSTAHGLFQMLYGGGGSVAQQITNGLNYIAGRYGDPNNAQRFWQSHHWYAKGGIPPVGEPFWVGERGPELMVAGTQTRVYSNEESRKMTGGDNSAMLADALRRLPAGIGRAVAAELNNPASGSRLYGRTYTNQRR